jgi:hypothetical protein
MHVFPFFPDAVGRKAAANISRNNHLWHQWIHSCDNGQRLAELLY